ncbi:MAG: hypothetical protein IKB65_07235 [Ruminiclostridium sp.]|nr:hypothetical protein [Ruminiclostridium sp.]
MRVLLLGNGFDLHYKLPTSYINFLHTVEFLVNNYTEEMRTVGDVLGNTTLQETDGSLKNCYEVNKDYCNQAALDKEEIALLIQLAQENLWYSYFLKSTNKDITWIDFEKEIGTVLAGVRESFAIEDVKAQFTPEVRSVMRYIITNFDFYVHNFGRNLFGFQPAYLLEEPVGSHHYILDKVKVIEKLSDSLDGLAVMLQIYLSQFAEKIAEQIAVKDRPDDLFLRLNAEKVLTFNYTKTYEMLFPGNHVEHIHGETSGEIVLGINPDEDDEIATVDTTFLPFKKYFQRVVQNTDLGYLALVDSLREECKSGPYKFVALTVMGHSLDVTDKDVIKEMFSVSNQIAILYHSQQALSSYVTKLVQIYGKNEFDLLRAQKDLRFISIDPYDTEIDQYLDSLRQLDELADLAFHV